MRATNWTQIIVITALCLLILNLSSCVTPGAKPEVKPEVKHANYPKNNTVPES